MGSKDGSVVWIIIILVRGTGVDKVPAFSPYGLKPTAEPGKLPLVAVVLEFTKEAVDIGGIGYGRGICVIDEDAGRVMVSREAGASRLGGKHRSKALE